MGEEGVGDTTRALYRIYTDTIKRKQRKIKVVTVMAVIFYSQRKVEVQEVVLL